MSWKSVSERLCRSKWVPVSGWMSTGLFVQRTCAQSATAKVLCWPALVVTVISFIGHCAGVVGRGSPPVGTLYVAVDGFFSPFLNSTWDKASSLSGSMVSPSLGVSMASSRVSTRVSPLVPGRIAQQHEGLLCRVVDACGELGCQMVSLFMIGLRQERA